LPPATPLAISRSGDIALALVPHLRGTMTYGTLARVAPCPEEESLPKVIGLLRQLDIPYMLTMMTVGILATFGPARRGLCIQLTEALRED
jgi:hypothetical protein